MAALYLALAFAAGWFASWRFSNWAVKYALHHPSLTERAFAKMRQENLLKVRDYVAAEIEKRRKP